MAAKIFDGSGYANSPSTIRARLQDIDQTDMEQVDITSITLTVRDILFPAIDIVTPVSINKTTTIFDTLQTWPGHPNGYNFKVDILKSWVPNTSTTYWFIFLFNPVSGEDFPALFRFRTFDPVI